MIDVEKIKSLTYEFIKALGEDPERIGLKETPERVSNMCLEIFSGVSSSPPKNLVKLFKEDTIENNFIEIQNIPVNSICEHHFLPFIGIANVKYIPKNGMIMGLSKFSRIVEYFSHKPQVQERLTKEIAEFLFAELKAKYVEVSLECEHLCMSMRGIKSKGTITHTTFKCGEI